MQSGGDYDRRERGLLALYRPRDLVEFDVHRAEARAGVVDLVPECFRVPYGVLRAYAATRGRYLGEEDLRSGLPPWHPCLYLWSAIRVRGGSGRYPPLIISAFKELYG